MDGSVVLDVDLGAGLGNDAFDRFAAWSNDEADLVWIDPDGFDTRGVLAKLSARAGKNAVHDIQDFCARLFGLDHRLSHDLVRDAGQFEIQLETGDADVRSTEFEIHVTEVIFAADNVGKRGVAFECLTLEFGNETDRDTGHWATERNTSVHKRKHASADTGHRCRSIGFHHFAHDTNGVREILLTWHDWLDRALGKGTVSDLAAVLSTETTSLTHAEWWEVVMKQEALRVRTSTVGVNHLSLVGRSQSRDAESLSLTTCKESGSMRARQEAGLAGERTELMKTTAVATLLAVENADAESFFLQIIKRLGDVELRGGWELLKNSGTHLVAQGADRFAASDFAGSVQSRLDAVAGDLVGDFQNRRVNLEERHRALFFANFGSELTLRSNDRLHGFTSKIKRGSELRFSEFVSSALDHDDFFTIADIHKVKIAIEALGVSRVNDKGSTDTSDTDCTDRSREWDVGNTQCGRSPVDREHVGIVLTIGA